jgi:hypothetical protein
MVKLVEILIVLIAAAIFIFIVYVCVCLFVDGDVFDIVDSFQIGDLDARSYSYTYTIQQNSWIQFWYNRGFAWGKRNTSDRSVSKREARNKSRTDRIMTKAKKKGWIE